MTTREKLMRMLTNRGMSDSQAEEVLKEAIPQIEKLTPDYKVMWDRLAEEYSETVYNAMWLLVRDVALKWIDKNVPQAWFRPLFE